MHELRHEARIDRQELGGYHLYISADRQRANKQLMERRQAIGQEPSATVPMSDETLIAVLVEALQGAELLVSARNGGVALGGTRCGCDDGPG